MNRDVSERLDGLVDVNRRGLLKGLAAGSVTSFSLPAAASTGDSVEITIEQSGEEIATVSPISTDRSIQDFYRYDRIDGASANTPVNLLESAIVAAE